MVDKWVWVDTAVELGLLAVSVVWQALVLFEAFEFALCSQTGTRILH